MLASKNILEYVPVDYVKVVVKGSEIDFFHSNSALEFIPVLLEGGEVKNYYAIYRGLKIETFPSGRITIAGSLHKFSNFGKHNHNDFPRSKFNQAIKHLCKVFRVRTDQLFITCMEIGVNIIPPVKTSLLLNNIFMHKTNDVEQRLSNDRAKFHCVELDKFQIKLYDKALQYDLPGELMRVELKYTNWSSCRNAGIITIQDFMTCSKLFFVKDLLRCWNELLFFDFTAQSLGEWNKYSNLNFWRDLRKTVTGAGYAYHVKKLREFNRKGENLQSIVSNLIAQKLIECSTT